MKKNLFVCAVLGIAFLVMGCPQLNGDKTLNSGNGGDDGDINTVTVNFFNESSFKVDIYLNVNPSSIDSSTKPIVTVQPGAIEKIKLPASADQTIGNVFYLRYNVQLADAFTSGTGSALYVQAKRDISNIAFVLKKDETYTKTISQPASGQLKFLQGYIKVQNTGSKSFQVLQGSTYLKKLGTAEHNLSSGKFGFYELNVSSLENAETISSLKFFVTDSANTITVEPFLLERGKVYSFECDGASVTGPAVTDITY